MPLRTANIVGSGPNGLAAAIRLAQRGVRVTVYERNAQVGGACTTDELTLPGFRHDVGSSVYPLGIASPFFRTLPLEQFGLRYIQPGAPLAHPLDDGSAVLLYQDLAATVAGLGEDGPAWRTLLEDIVADWPVFINELMGPLLRLPRHPFGLAHFGVHAAMPASLLGRLRFKTQRARALLAGLAAHSVLPLTRVGSSGAGLVLAAAGHATGWPVAAGGAGSVTQALADYLVSLGGRIYLNAEIRHTAQMDYGDVILFDTSPPAVDRIAGRHLTPSFRTRMRHFEYGPGVFKIDWALREPIPWRAAACLQAGTVHVGGTMHEIGASEAAAFSGRHTGRPFVLVVQPSLFDPSRAPEGRHTAWGYCHVPNGSDMDMTEIIESQVSRFAPGFRDCILARAVSGPVELERWNPNLVGGDLSGGSMTISQMLTRPTAHLYRTSNPRIYICSSSTPPGGGVHGMCGYGAAEAVLWDWA
ncbi:MAG TPA: NAD(P)/FAD-dependent oxidoreductase [Acidobacteriaceae bacterium]|nr:NAD(P)/FAD-dependent oxidoreductase [Acidobacteriaceae bacterium]